MTALPLTEAATALGVSPATLRRMLLAGAPVARRGARGRGRATLVDPRAVAAWEASCEASARVDVSAIPDLLAAALAEAFDQAEGLPKQRMAAFVAVAWYAAATRVMDHLRESDPTVPDVDAVPLAIERLRKIARI